MDDKDKKIEELQAAIAAKDEALNDLFGMMEEGLLVRDISNDHKTDYFVKAEKFTQRLVKAKSALSLDCGKAITEELERLRAALDKISKVHLSYGGACASVRIAKDALSDAARALTPPKP
jgi:hypothetical protein